MKIIFIWHSRELLNKKCCDCGLKYYENHNGDNCCENSSGGFNPVVPPGVIPGVI